MTEQRLDLGLTSSSAGGCGCGHAHATSTPASSPAEAGTTTILVEGMTCAHCVRSVTEELTALDAVTGVDVDLRPGAASVVRIASNAPLPADAIAAAIDEAGYTLTT